MIRCPLCEKKCTCTSQAIKQKCAKNKKMPNFFCHEVHCLDLSGSLYFPSSKRVQMLAFKRSQSRGLIYKTLRRIHIRYLRTYKRGNVRFYDAVTTSNISLNDNHQPLPVRPVRSMAGNVFCTFWQFCFSTICVLNPLWGMFWSLN